MAEEKIAISPAMAEKRKEKPGTTDNAQPQSLHPLVELTATRVRADTGFRSPRD